jgi:hypothetical protein
VSPKLLRVLSQKPLDFLRIFRWISLTIATIILALSFFIDANVDLIDDDKSVYELLDAAD